MKETREYDLAANKFYASLGINSLPLTSWDLYSTFFSSICKSYNDVVSLLGLAKEQQWSYKEQFNEELFQKETIIVVTDPELNIVHATQNIVHMNGYHPEEILGKKPKIFQGKETCMKTSSQIREAIQNGESFEAIILNYRKDGSSYNCWIKGEPIFNTSGKIVNFIAYEKEVA